jgi:hypothetical protein
MKRRQEKRRKQRRQETDWERGGEPKPNTSQGEMEENRIECLPSFLQGRCSRLCAAFLFIIIFLSFLFFFLCVCVRERAREEKGGR